jgi:serine phosphatase RsbU (regulator of sigma subunit)
MTAHRPSHATWSIVAQSVAATLLLYVLAGTVETGLIAVFRPSESELTWVSDVLLASAFGVALYLWRHLSVARRALAERERAELVLNAQLEIAADLQRRLLPALPAAGHGVEWAASLQPAGRIGGDFYDFVPLAEGEWMLLVADVSGKGIPAAMALSALRATFRTVATATDGPGHVLTHLSSALYEQWSGAPCLTAVVAKLDRRTATMTYANAGHPAGILAGPGGVRPMAALGPPAAMLPGMVYEEQALPIAPGDVCVLVSDGVTEALGDDGGSIVEEIVVRGHAAGDDAAALCNAVMVAAQRGPGPQGVVDWQDDRTVVVVAINDDAGRPTNGLDWRAQQGGGR